MVDEILVQGFDSYQVYVVQDSVQFEVEHRNCGHSGSLLFPLLSNDCVFPELCPIVLIQKDCGFYSCCFTFDILATWQ